MDGDQQTLDLRRQLQVVEQEAVVLRTKIQTLETENEKLLSENKHLDLLKATRKLSSGKSSENETKYLDQIATLEVDLTNANRQIADLNESEAKRNDEINTLKNKLNVVSFIQKNVIVWLL